ncbi:quercetin 2,3-dioxygenase [Nitrincola sp. A-D6]|uniref:pirin family protein n=1 Tax=Nitrincola sp. A-D6 TaxID=1545442 RepID=UPI00051FEF4A|nr:pirin family protein [Nitrincola sp. A-D6]KGK43141.1 quercetin 2,3-dioxygenase [Nitrincola sp. A-D6]
MQTQTRKIKRIIKGIDSQDGAGVKLKRSIGQRQHLRIDPFLMLDMFSSDNPDDYIAGFPPHPHRGFETVTYMLNGSMLHRDHMGNEGLLNTGGVQWMTAGRGVIHEERPQQESGLMRGFQLWINLPASDKMKPAAYQNIEPEQIPVIQSDQATLRLVAGELEIGAKVYKGPVQGIVTQPVFIDISLKPHSQLVLPLAAALSGFIYLFEGEALLQDETLQTDAAVELDAGEQLSLATHAKSARMLLVAAKPLNEPIAQYGPFVMNNMEQIEQALRDYRDGVLAG